jgi:hypothetical protein
MIITFFMSSILGMFTPVFLKVCAEKGHDSEGPENPVE